MNDEVSKHRVDVASRELVAAEAFGVGMEHGRTIAFVKRQLLGRDGRVNQLLDGRFDLNGRQLGFLFL